MNVEEKIGEYAPRFDMAAGYSDCVELIKENFQNMAENVVAIGFYLKHIRDEELYKDGGYGSFSEFAKEEFGLSPTSTSRYMSINDRFSIDGNSPALMEDKKSFSKSQLQEMLRLTDEQLETVTPDMTVKQIRELATSQEVEIACKPEEDDVLPGQMDIEFFPEVLPDGYKQDERAETVYQVSDAIVEKPEELEESRGEVILDAEFREIEETEQKLSAYGVPKTERPDGSLLTTPGCGEGKHDCFSCAMLCEIRQEFRCCVHAPMGAPFPCTRMGDDVRKDMAAGMYKDDCQFLNPNFAEKTARSFDPDPCCGKCEHKSVCDSSCEQAARDAAKNEADQKKQSAAKRAEESLEAYELSDVRRLLDREEKMLNMYRMVNREDPDNPMPEGIMKKQCILVDALRLLIYQIESQELEAETRAYAQKEN